MTVLHSIANEVFPGVNPYAFEECVKRLRQGDLAGATGLVGKQWDVFVLKWGLQMNPRHTQLTKNRAIEYCYGRDELPYKAHKREWQWLFDKHYRPAKNYNKRRVPTTQTVYRGGVPQGWSWTTDPERAEWFAHRWRGQIGEQRVWRAEIPSEVILFFRDGYECETVCDTKLFKQYGVTPVLVR